MWNTLLIQPLFNLLVVLYNLLGHNMGLAIIALTLLVRLILLPPTIKSLMAQKKLKDLQHEMAKIKKDHGHDKAVMTKKTMELYQKHGVNPLSSCLPLLIQLPILFALYRVFFTLGDSSSLNNLYPFVTRPEVINTHFLWMDLAKFDQYYVLPILAGVFQFLLSKLAMAKSEAPLSGEAAKDKDKKPEETMQNFQKMFSTQMIYLFPVMTIFIAARLPSALALYWTISTLFAVVQQYLVEKEKLVFSKKAVVTVEKGK